MSLLAISPSEIKMFRRRLLSWFAKRKRDLPWRRTNDPYRIWVSEVMLQQTRVAAAIPYYERFLETFPTVQSLAHAKSEAVLRKWAGLGYYSRARNLQRAAKDIVALHGGQFPRTLKDALALPGIGHYTASAVLSIAYGEPLAALDGNVARVVARVGAVRGDLRAPAVWRSLEAAARDLLAKRVSGDWNQAMMELGATVCTPKSPRCELCPVANWCRAKTLGIASEVPAIRKKRATVDVTLAAAVLLDPRGNTLLVRQTDGALFSRMWQFPALESTGDEAASILETFLAEKFGIKIRGNMATLESARHSVTFRKIRLEPFLIRVVRLPRVPGARVIALARVATLPISNATRKIADAGLQGGAEQASA